MRVCHVIPGLEQRNGGPSRSVRSLCRAQARAGHQVELLATAPDASAEGDCEHDSPGFIIRTFRRDWPGRFCPSATLQRALRGVNADVLHHHALWLRTLHYAARTAGRHRIPLIVSPRGMMSRWAWRHHRARKLLARLLVHPAALAHTTGWHATSVDEAAEIEARGFRQPACIAPNGVDAPTRTDVEVAAQFWHAECPATTNRRTALFYGRFHEKKRVVELIDLWLEQAPTDWLLLLVGIPEQYSPAMLESYVHKMGGAGRVQAYSGADRPAPYAVASLFLLPSHNENFGLVIAEALAHGVPTLVTDTTPWSELNVRGSGWCVPWADFGPVLARATAEPADALRSRGSVGRTWVLDEYSWDRVTRPLLEFYGRLAPSGAV